MQLSYGSTSTCTLTDELFECPAKQRNQNDSFVLKTDSSASDIG